MAKYTRLQVAQAMNETGLVPLYYHKDVEVCKNALKACYDGGARVFEFTNRGDFAHEVFGELNKYALKELPGMMMGVGSVVDAGTCSLYIQLGANFIVSPLFNPDMAKACNRRKILWIPGCGTISEIGHAEEFGAEIVKIFPGLAVGGPDFVKSILAPCPWTSIMPSGGVSTSEENLKMWFNAGVTCVGIGSQIFTGDIIKEGKYEKITLAIKEVLEIINKLKK
jgi:2-dehydro-3-deoxyphosphogluconate aldolase / (4S)-4-hydroxy-2-oxoglutarate aldolase